MNYGKFSGTPKTEWLTEAGSDRNMRLLEDFWFDDPKGLRWDAPVGSIIDGASIPEALWSSVGSPYTGSYRRASIVHDIACASTSIPREQSDEMFYSACLAGGCSLVQAKLLYAGVRIGAWSASKNLDFENFEFNAVVQARLPNQLTQRELEIRAKFTVLAIQLKSCEDSLDKIREVVNSELN